MSGKVSEHTLAINQQYGGTPVLEGILRELESAGKHLDALTPEDLRPFEEFHLRSRSATMELAEMAGVAQGLRVLDVGSGVGGPARTLSANFGCLVTGADLSWQFCRAARMLSHKVGSGDIPDFIQGEACRLPFQGEVFDVVWMQHVSMNIDNKRLLLAGIRHVLRRGGRLAFHEVLDGGGRPPHFPVPWADDPSISFLISPHELHTLLEIEGFKRLSFVDDTPECVAWGRRVFQASSQKHASPLGMDLVVGGKRLEKNANLLRNMEEGRVVVYMGVFERWD